MGTREIQVFNPEQLAVIKATVAKGTTNEEFKLFIEVCKYHGLNPFARQIYAIVRSSQDGSRNLCIQTSIDGYRLLAERTGKYAGQIGPQWCGEDEEWKDVWLKKQPPTAARVGVLRKDFDQPTWGIAKFDSYVSTGPLWRKMPDVMLAKCAEALALRKAFPAEMSGIYTKEEMDQADDLPAVERSTTTVESDASTLASEKQITGARKLLELLGRAIKPEDGPFPEGTTFEQARVIIKTLTDEYTAFRQAQKAKKTVVVESTAEPAQQPSKQTTRTVESIPDQAPQDETQGAQINPAQSNQVAFLRSRVETVNPQNSKGSLDTEAYYASIFRQPYPGDDALPVAEWARMIKALKDLEEKRKEAITTEKKA